MKKLFMAMAAVAMLFSGCSNDNFLEEEASIVPEKKEIKFDFNFSAAGDAETRAVQKTAWEAGDIIYVSFKGQENGLLKFTYDGTNWTHTTYGTLDLNAVASNDTKKCFAFWVEGNPGDADIKTTNTTYWCQFATGGQCFLYHENNTYSYNESTNTISANFTLQRDPKSVKIAVSGLGEETWQICAKEFEYIEGAITSGDSWYYPTISDNKGNDKNFADGFKMGDETCYNVLLNNGFNANSADAGSVIYLKNTKTEKIYRKQFAGKKLRSMGGKTINITFSESTWSEISASDFDNLSYSTMDVIPSPTTGILNGHAWIDFGIRKSDFDTSITPGSEDDRRIVFATTNIGADNPEDYGYYFRWGELQGWMVTNSNTTIKSAKQYDKNGYPTSLAWSSTTFTSTGWALSGQESAVDFQGKTNLTCNGQTYGDAATYYWGEGWMMMNYDLANKFECGYLPMSKTIGKAYVKLDYSTKNDVSGIEIKDNNSDASIFLPAAGVVGYSDGATLYQRNKKVNYWLSTPYNEGSNHKGYHIGSESSSTGYFYLPSWDRFYGFPIRPIAELPLD